MYIERIVHLTLSLESIHVHVIFIRSVITKVGSGISSVYIWAHRTHTYAQIYAVLNKYSRYLKKKQKEWVEILNIVNQQSFAISNILTAQKYQLSLYHFVCSTFICYHNAHTGWTVNTYCSMLHIVYVHYVKELSYQ